MDIYLIVNNGLVEDIVYGHSRNEVKEKHQGREVIKLDSMDIDRIVVMAKGMRVLR